jgi:formyltetrahydrofolate-dependent phosphoribosylglycinamide formyltransferase
MIRIAVFASGGGSNLQSLLDTCRPPQPAEIALVVSDKPTARALERARAAGVRTEVVSDPADGASITKTLRAAGIDFVVLAGYLKLVPAAVVTSYEKRIVNIHPALLPSFGGKGMYGMHVHRAVLDSGATVSGATVHLVDAAYDRGPIVAQWPVPVLANDTPEALQQRVLEVEHQLLPTVVLAAARAGHVVRLPFESPAFALNPGVADVPRALAVTQDFR